MGKQDGQNEREKYRDVNKYSRKETQARRLSILVGFARGESLSPSRCHQGVRTGGKGQQRQLRTKWTRVETLWEGPYRNQVGRCCHLSLEQQPRGGRSGQV